MDLCCLFMQSRIKKIIEDGIVWRREFLTLCNIHLSCSFLFVVFSVFGRRVRFHSLLPDIFFKILMLWAKFYAFLAYFCCSTPMPVWILNATFENLIMLKRLLEIKLDFLGDETWFFVALEVRWIMTWRTWELSFRFSSKFQVSVKEKFCSTCQWILEALPIHLVSKLHHY